MRLIAGLGNPGRLYEHSRHNIGFMCLNHLARTQGIHLDKKRGNARTGIGEIAGEAVLLARPQTGMNESGQAIEHLTRRFEIKPDDLVIIHDDLDLPMGKIRIRFGGSAAGHHGIESIISHLESQDFYRVRIGIGRPPWETGREKESEIIGYVLSDFTPEEKESITHTIAVVSQAIACLLTEGLQAAMDKYN